MSETDPAAPRKRGPRPKTTRPRVSLVVRLDPVLKTLLDRYAARTARTQNASASMALMEGLLRLCEEEKIIVSGNLREEVEHR